MGSIAYFRVAALFLTCGALLGEPLPVRGLHLAAPKPADMPMALRFIREALPREGVNTLVLEINYGFRSAKRPEVAEPDSLSREQIMELAQACRESNVELVPMINLLGHQSWARRTFGLLRAHPEFDETPGMYPENQGTYCRSYCPRHPEVHKVVFDLIDELVEWTGARVFHAGLDEVFLLGEDSCPRCKGANRAELFAGEVKAIRDHLAVSKRELWIWADRLIDDSTTGIGEWEASRNGTAAALAAIPKDVVLCDWHYEAAHPTATYFALQGFRVMSSPWRKPNVALEQLALTRQARAAAAPAAAARMLGMLQTTWVGFAPFAQAYFREGTPGVQAVESAQCFRTLFEAMRKAN